MKILILGYAGHGKDEVAGILSKNSDMKFTSTSVWVCEKIIFPILRVKYGYKTVQECFEDRDNHRIEWRDLVNEYNTPDLTRLVRENLFENDIYVGLRDHDQYKACMDNNLFDYVLFVDAWPRNDFNDLSMNIKFDPSKMFLVKNDGSKKDLESFLFKFLMIHNK
jgi:hypothetical protein